MGLWEWGFRPCLPCQIPLPPTSILGALPKVKNWTGHRDIQWGEHDVTVRGLGSGLHAASL